MALDLTCAYCLLRNKISSDKPAVTLYQGTALCKDHLEEYEKDTRGS